VRQELWLLPPDVDIDHAPGRIIEGEDRFVAPCFDLALDGLGHIQERPGAQQAVTHKCRHWPGKRICHDSLL
jgi:hypothetical protein